MAEWYENPYPQSSKPPTVSFPRQVQVGVDDGPDITAYKRAVSRAGRWPWQTYDDTYSESFASGKGGGNVGDSGVKGFQRQCKLADDGVIGNATFEKLRTSLIPKGLPNAGQPLFDQTALNLLKQAGGTKPPSQQGAAALTDYAKRSIGNEPRIHYSQNRPMTHLDVPPEQGFTADCSGHATSSYKWAGWLDPNKVNYNGYGYTGTLINNPPARLPWQVGDLAIYGTSRGNTTHVCTCYQGGDNISARFVSHGSEAGPYSVQLYYRGDLVAVVRPAK